MKVPANLTVVEGTYLTDGGSIWLRATDDSGNLHDVFLAQHRLPPWEGEKYIQGRLYFDGELVVVRSAQEARLVARLKAAPIASLESPTEKKAENRGVTVVIGEDLQEYHAKMAESKRAALGWLIERLVKFVGSKQYVKLAKKNQPKGGENNNVSGLI